MNIDLLPLSVGIGLAVSLLFTEAFGLTAGGMVVPGYLALAWSNPLDVLITVGAGLIAFLLVRALSAFLVIYGRRRTVLMILVGYAVGMGLRALPGLGLGEPEAEVVGYIIPGLIAIGLDRQGVVETLTALTTASIVVRLILVAVVGVELDV